MKLDSFFWLALPLWLILLYSREVKCKRQGSLLQPIGGDGSPPSQSPPQVPPRGSGSQQSLLQPFTGNVYNSHSGDTSSGTSHDVPNSDQTITFQSSGGNTLVGGGGGGGGGSGGGRRPRPTRRPPGSSPIQPAGSDGTLNSGDSSVPGFSNPFGGGGSISFPSSQGSSQSDSSSSSSSSSSGSSFASSPGSSLASQSSPSSSSSSSSSVPSNNNDVNLNIAGFSGFGSSSSNKNSENKNDPDRTPEENNAQSVKLSTILIWTTVLVPLLTMTLLGQWDAMLLSTLTELSASEGLSSL